MKIIKPIKRKKMNKIQFVKVREVKSPVRAFPTDAGIDFFMPKLDETLIRDILQKNPHSFGGIQKSSEGTTLYINPGQRVLIPSGIKVWFMDCPPSALIAANKSGLSTKYGIQFTAEVVDQSYSGEVHIGIVNLGDQTVRFHEDDKLIQFIHTPVFTSILEEVDINYYKATVSNWESSSSENRGEGGFGSTDKK